MRKSISVALAAYNGEKYIRKQIESILMQLEQNDELVISLDPSLDGTEDIIQSFHDSRIKLIHGKGKGVISNFENAVVHTSNDIIFLCDQDDIWMENKVEEVLSCFDENVKVVMHDCIVVDENMNTIYPSFFKHRNTKLGIVHNIMKNSYIGCCMAFTSDLKENILPFPNDLPMHDQYIGLMGEMKGKNVLLNKALLYYRRHDDNASDITHSNALQMIKWRLQIIKDIL